MTGVIQVIIDQHAEEAAFLWLLRRAAVAAPHYDLKDLAQLDERVEAHVDGLRVAGPAGWEACVEGLAHEEAGELFAAGVLALESGLPERLEVVCEAGAAAPEALTGLCSAFGWVEGASLRGTVRDLLRSESAFRRRLGITACALHRVDAGNALGEAIADDDATLAARALRATGECGRVDLLPVVRQHLKGEDEARRFWAAWSGILLGDRAACLETLAALAAADGAFGARSQQVLLRTMTVEVSREWLKTLLGEGRLRDVVIGTGIVGDPAYVPWLLEQMETPEVARVAGEAFSMITGVDLAYDDLEGEWPEGFESGPTEEPEDEDVSMDADEDLPWPDAALVEQWWSANGERFVSGGRYLCGQAVSAEHSQTVLSTGFQRQRNAAALELALMRPDAHVFETRAPGVRQQRLLGV